MMRRVVILAALFMASTALLAVAGRRDFAPPREPLARFPLKVAQWEGRPAPDFEARILEVLGVDDHLNYLFFRGQEVIALYVGYYQSQREGDAIHSPMNCLPGAGWQPVQTGRLTIPIETPGEERSIEVNRVIIQKGEQRQLVLYWYQGRGRVVASEYWSKIHLVADSIQQGRSDAALIRIVTPMQSAEPSAIEAAERQATQFAQAIFPILSRYIPS